MSISKILKEQSAWCDGLTKKEQWFLAKKTFRTRKLLNSISDKDFLLGIRVFVASDDLGG
jgi:hypothetical protein